MSHSDFSLSRRDLALGAVAAIAVAKGGIANARSSGKWNKAQLQIVAQHARRDGSAALMVSHQGRIILSDGEVARPFFLHSMRKSLMSALYGIEVDAKRIDLNTTVGEVGIDDDPKLTDVEKKATIRDLLEARSGVYIPTAAEAPTMKAKRPPRGSHAPGTFWYYNNWDFNVLGNIYERLTTKSIFDAFHHWFAEPLGMQDFDPFEHGLYSYEKDTPRYPAYHMQFTARDLMRFGQLFLQRGRWGDKQILSPQWVAESTRLISPTDFPEVMSGYGYLWWVAAVESVTGPSAIPLGSFTGAGAGGHFLTVMPELDLVVCNRVDTFGGNLTSPIARPKIYSALLREIIAAHPARA